MLKSLRLRGHGAVYLAAECLEWGKSEYQNEQNRLGEFPQVIGIANDITDLTIPTRSGAQRLANQKYCRETAEQKHSVVISIKPRRSQGKWCKGFGAREKKITR